MNARLLPLLGFMVFACTEEPTQPGATEFPPPEDGTVQVNVDVAPQPDGITVITLTLDAKSLALGAYQGRFRFNPEVLELIDYNLPRGDYRFVNANNAKEGEIRFAGFTVEQFENPVALVLLFRTKRVLERNDIRTELEVVGDVLGRELERERILEPRLQIVR